MTHSIQTYVPEQHILAKQAYTNNLHNFLEWEYSSILFYNGSGSVLSKNV